MSIHVIYENGVFRPLVPIELPEKSELEITQFNVINSPELLAKYPLLRLVEIAQKYPDDPTTPTDFAAQHDHYLYGTPKRP